MKINILINMTMIDLTKNCMKCNNLQKNKKKELKCGLTNKLIHFEDSCDLFEINKVLQDKNDSELSNKSKFNNANIGKRIGNYFIDIIAISILEVILGIVIVKLYGIESVIYSIFFNNYIGKYVLYFLISIIYYSIFETITGKTIGKYFTKTKVLTLYGEKPDFLRILLRSLCRHIPLDQLSFILYDKTGWHDTLSKTIVILDSASLREAKTIQWIA